MREDADVPLLNGDAEEVSITLPVHFTAVVCGNMHLDRLAHHGHF
jgi:hypothetical protein